MFFAGVLVVLVPIGLSEAFLLSNTSSNGIGTNEFQYLSQMIFSGEQSRHYVENEVTTLDQRVTRLEQDLRTKYVQALNLKDFEYEQKLLNITGFVEKIMNNTKIGFEKKLNETQLALERQIQIGKNLQRAFDKEMTNRLQLEQHYTELMIDFQNVSAARNADIAEIRRNSNSTLNGIKSLDLELKSIGASVDKNMAEIAMINTSILNFESSAVHSVSSFLIVNQTLSAVSSRLQNISMGLSTCRADIKQLKQANGYQSAFSVSGIPTTGNGSIIFPAVATNFGGHYDPSSGKFTCIYSGHYLFLLTIYKKAATLNEAYCWISKNGRNTVIAEAYPGSTGFDGYLSASNFVILHLVKGDTVELANCSPISTIYHTSSFSGFLLHAD